MILSCPALNRLSLAGLRATALVSASYLWGATLGAAEPWPSATRPDRPPLLSPRGFPDSPGPHRLPPVDDSEPAAERPGSWQLPPEAAVIHNPHLPRAPYPHTPLDRPIDRPTSWPPGQSDTLVPSSSLPAGDARPSGSGASATDGAPRSDSERPIGDRRSGSDQWSMSTEPIVSTLSGPRPVHGEPLESARIVALVGNQAILAGDLMPQIYQILKAQNIPPDQLTAAQQMELLRQILPRAIDAKLVYLDFLRTVPPDRLPTIEERLDQQYDQDRMSEAMELVKVSSPAELDAKLREFGSSLDKQRRSFGEQVMMKTIVDQKVRGLIRISRDDLWQYYQDHKETYRIDPKARWQLLSARFDRCAGQAGTRQAIEQMAELLKRGVPWTQIAEKYSHDVRASDGGQYDWTTEGSLVSDVIDKAIFSIPPNQVSPILEDKTGMHLVQVHERIEGGYVPFEQTQAEIKEKLNKERFDSQLKEFVEELRKTTYVWTIFDS